jgi:hypothetical protein
MTHPLRAVNLGKTVGKSWRQIAALASNRHTLKEKQQHQDSKETMEHHVHNLQI